MPTNTYVALSTQTVAVATPSVTFTSIPQGYTDLVLVMSPISSSGQRQTYMEINGDTSAIYSRTILSGTGSSAVSARNSNQSQTYLDFYGAVESSVSTNKIIQFMNYSNTSTFKTILTRANDTLLGTDAIVHLWRSTAAITQIKIYIDAVNFAVGSTFTIYGIAAASTLPGTAKATGGTISYDQYGNVIHTFTGNGTFTPTEPLTNVETLVVAGAGGGAVDFGGGGGAGGYIASIVNLAANAYTVTVGAGGVGGTRANGADGGNGGPSSIAGTGLTTISAAGGGGGGSFNGTLNGRTGGSAGGGAGGYSNISGIGGIGNTPTLTPAQGFNGGRGFAPSGFDSNRRGGGGGGAIASGTDGTSGTHGIGGNGAINVIRGSASTYAKGGDGCVSQSFSTPTIGAVNTGNGGQGAGENHNGGAGGSGIVIIRYQG